MNDRFWDLLAKYYTNQLTPEEKAAFDKLLLQKPSDWLKTGELSQIDWDTTMLYDKEKAGELAERIMARDKETNAQLLPVRSKRRTGKALVISCTLLFLSLAGIFLWQIKKSNEWQTISTAAGIKTTLLLPDGTEISLNSESTFRYPKKFDRHLREVYLSGEAFFKVAHDKSKPFIVHTHDMNVRVLGTEFNVRAYTNEPFSETALIKGSVVVSFNGVRQNVSLKPRQKIIVRDTPHKDDINDHNGQQAVPDIELKPLTPDNENIYSETAWKENEFIFDDESLESLSKRLERWYGVTISISDSTLAAEHFTGRAGNVPLEKLLDILKMIKPFEYAIEDKQVIIKEAN